MMKTMRALILIISLITIVSCGKEPSLLDKCITSNQEEFNFFDKWRTWGKENIQLQKKHLPSGEWETIELKKDYHRMIVNHTDAFLNSLTDDEYSVFQKLGRDRFSKDKEAIDKAKTLQADFIKLQRDKAKKICNMQGIY